MESREAGVLLFPIKKGQPLDGFARDSAVRTGSQSPRASAPIDYRAHPSSLVDTYNYPTKQ